jgi:hypothetical protein
MGLELRLQRVVIFGTDKVKNLNFKVDRGGHRSKMPKSPVGFSLSRNKISKNLSGNRKGFGE